MCGEMFLIRSESLGENLLVRGPRCGREEELVTVLDACSGVGAGLAQHALRQMTGCLHKRGIIEQGHGLQGGVGDFGAQGAALAVGAVEDLHAGWRNGALPVGI